MNTRTLDVALRIRADLDQAVKQVDALVAETVKLEGAGQKAGKGLNAAATAADKNSNATRGNATAAKAATTQQTALAVATQKTSTAQQKGAISAAQHAMAMRQLPMQITDIVTGLASGQSVFMVAIQQGGQLKDSFGGITPAARALLGVVSPLFLAVSAGAATFAALGLALHQVYEEQQATAAALLSTGNYVGSSVQQVDALVDKLAELEGVTQGGAREALLAVAASGRIAGDQFERVATVAARMEAATGQSIDTTVQKFEAIAREPVAALLKLNETEHFLTAAQLERVRALVEEGREQDAAAEGARIYADRLDDIANAAEEARPHLARLWREMKEGASSAWESTKNIAEFLAASAEKYRELPWYQRFGPAAGMNFYRAMWRAEPAAPAEVPRVAGAVDSDAERKKEKTRQQAEQEWARLKQSNLSKEQKLEAEIAAIKKVGVALGKSEADIEAQIAQARQRYKESLPKGRTGEKSDAEQAEASAQRELANLDKQIALMGQLEEGERQVSKEAQIRYEIERGAFVGSSEAAQRELIEKAKKLDAMRAEREEAEKQQRAYDVAERNYERLRQQLETPVEAAVADVKAKVDALNEAMNLGVPIAGGYKDALDRIFEQSYSEAPKLPGGFDPLQNDPTGLVRDQSQLDGYLQRLNEWYAQQQAIIAAGRASNASLNDQWNAQEERVSAEHASRLAALTQAQHQMQLSATQSIFASMAQIAYSAAGEQSKAYQLLFAISKGFAIAQAAVALAQNVAEASKVGFPQNLPLIAGAFAQGAQIASILAGANFSAAGYAGGGRIVGPGTPTSDSVPIWASRDEHMIRASSATQPGARAFLDDFNERGMPALWSWARGFADGGPILPTDYDAGGAPRSLAVPGAGSRKLRNSMRLYLAQDVDHLRSLILNHPEADKKIVATIGENRGAVEVDWSF